MREIIEDWVKRIQSAEKVEQYEKQVAELKHILMEKKADSDVLNIVNEKSQFIKNVFSESVNIENMKKSRDELVIYLQGLISKNDASPNELDFLIHYLERFPLF